MKETTRNRHINTGVYATPEEVVELRKLSEQARETWIDERALGELARRIDECAVSHGLPAPPMMPDGLDHYGMSPKGEFTRMGPRPADPPVTPRVYWEEDLEAKRLVARRLRWAAESARLRGQDLQQKAEDLFKQRVLLNKQAAAIEQAIRAKLPVLD